MGLTSSTHPIIASQMVSDVQGRLSPSTASHQGCRPGLQAQVLGLHTRNNRQARMEPLAEYEQLPQRERKRGRRAAGGLGGGDEADAAAAAQQEQAQSARSPAQEAQDPGWGEEEAEGGEQGAGEGADGQGREHEAQHGSRGAEPPSGDPAHGTGDYEYLDHTADIQLHAWGPSLEVAFANTALAMYNYMTPLEHIEPLMSREFTAEAHDMESLLFAFLDELLFVFHTEMLVCREVHITKLDREAWTITATGRGEEFDRSKHEQGTEIKAITYSAMQIYDRQSEEKQCDVYVIVDI